MKHKHQDTDLGAGFAEKAEQWAHVWHLCVIRFLAQSSTGNPDVCTVVHLKHTLLYLVYSQSET